MGLMSWLRGDDLERRGADPTVPWGSSAIPLNSQTGQVAAGVALTDDVALSITSVYTAVSILVDAVSTLPIVCYKRNDTGRGIIPSPPLITDPWPEGTQQDWIAQVVNSLALRGNFFGKIIGRDGRGYPSMIQPLHPDSVLARRDLQGKRAYWIDGRPVPTEDVFHVPHQLVAGSFIGLNPVEYMRQSWGGAAAAERYAGQFYANSANPSGVLEFPEDLTEEEALAAAQSWRTNHGGLQGAGLPAVLTGGATWKTISIAPDDAQFLQTRQLSDAHIAAFFRIPPHKMGLIDRTPQATDSEEVEMAFVADALMGYISRIEAHLAKIMPGTTEPRFDLSARLRGNMTARYTNYALGINNRIINPDEARQMENLNPLPKGMGQTFWGPLNFAPIDKILDGTAAMGGTLPPGQGGQGGGLDQHPDGGGKAPNPPNNPKAPVDGSP